MNTDVKILKTNPAANQIQPYKFGFPFKKIYVLLHIKRGKSEEYLNRYRKVFDKTQQHNKILQQTMNRRELPRTDKR